MMRKIFSHTMAATASVALMVSLAACGDNVRSDGTASAADSNSVIGRFQGAGASTQKLAIEAWIASYQQSHPQTQIAYNPTGSGAGVTSFLTGALSWASSDAALSDEEVDQSKSVCATGTAFEIPVYISPIVIIFNLDGISGEDQHLNLDAETIAKIFDGKITKWNDPAIVKQNKDVKLPNLDITVVHRSDKSGTTKNFLSYVKDVAGDDWPYTVGENWPNSVGQGASGTDGVVTTVSQANGTISYVDASKVGTLGSISVKVGDEYVPYSAEAATRVIDDSELETDLHGENRIVLKVNHNTEKENAYPIVLVSYDIACPAYKNNDMGAFVKSWFSYIISEEGQKVAADNTGSAPLSNSLRNKISEVID
ncbi:MAG: phosphate ABC transporter substrate-binding protein PstS, partial [Bifidobacteriaceae bacterium]|nr:phosphate ABC transporter substrate-binding protein PstS [Bifidobacteriaceae bacterium]